MIFKAGWLGLWFCGSLAFAAPPDAGSILRQSAQEPKQPYSAELSVTQYGLADQQSGSRQIRVYFSPPGLYRREILNSSGTIRQLIVDDGQTEWIYDLARRKIWKGESSQALYKRFGPEEELERLEENYLVQVLSGERVAGRLTWQLELRSRKDHAVCRRFWVDRKNNLLLRSEFYRPDGSLAMVMDYSRLQFKKELKPELFRFSPPEGISVLNRLEPDYLALDEAKAASGIEPRLPSWLPPGYVFESLDVLPRGRKRAIHYRYSDGVNVLSYFQCPAKFRLNFKSGARRRLRMSQGTAALSRTSEGSLLSWVSGEWRFILVGTLSDGDLKRVAESIK